MSAATTNEINMSAFDLTPQMSKACSEFGKEFRNSVQGQQFHSALIETVAKYEAKYKNSKKELRKLGQEISVAEKKLTSLKGEKQKAVRKLTEIRKHEKQMWTMLNAHVTNSATLMKKIKEIQQEVTDCGEEQRGMEEKAKTLHEKITSMSNTFESLKSTKQQLLDEKSRLEQLFAGQGSMEEKSKEITQKKEKCKELLVELEQTRNVLKGNQEKVRKQEEQERQMQLEIEEASNKINQSVTEANHLKLQIESKEVEVDRQILAIQQKTDSVQKLCETRENELQAKLKQQKEALQSEVASIDQKNACLEANYSAQCEKQKENDLELVKARAEMWQEKERRKERLARESTRHVELIAMRKRHLQKVQSQLKSFRASEQEMEKQRLSLLEHENSKSKESKEPPLKRSKVEFKKPVPPNSNRVDYTNALFNSLQSRTPSQILSQNLFQNQSQISRNDTQNSFVSQTMRSTSTPNMTKLSQKNNTTMNFEKTRDDDEDDDHTSILSLSSLDDLEALHTRLNMEDEDIADESLRFFE